MLATVHHPATTIASAPPLLIVHGLFGSGRNWGVIARRLADVRDVTVVDMRNHGNSPRFATQTYADMAADLAEVAQAMGGPVDVLGHSMGGKASMILALTQPGLVHSLVVADIAPVAYSHDQTQHIHAMRDLDLSGTPTRAEIDRRFAQAVPDAGLRAFFLQSLDLRATPPEWRLNFEVLEAEMPTIVGWPQVTGHYDGRTLFLTGSDSSYVKPEYRDEILALFPHARFAKIPGAGHWLHAERPREFEETVRVFLAG